MVKIKVVLVLAAFSLFFSCFSQNLVKSTFNKNSFTFELTFENDNGFPVFVNEVGAVSQLNFGEFNCESKLWVPDPATDFVVNVPAASETKFVKTKPLVKFEPGEVKTISFSIVPDVAKACGTWAMDLTAIVNFDFGYTFYSAPELIMSQDVEMLSHRIYTDEELPSLLNDMDGEKKIKAIEELKFSNIDDKSLQFYLSSKLKDKDPKVRSAAAIAVMDNKATPLYEQVGSNLFSTMDQDEIEVLIRVIGKLKITKGVDPLIGRLVNGSIEDARSVTKTLRNIGSPDVLSKARYIVKKQSAWSHGNEMEQEKYTLLTALLIGSKDQLSIPIIQSVLSSSTTAPEVKYDILANLAGWIDGYAVSEDAYLSNFKEYYSTFLNSSESYARFSALNLYLASDTDDKSKSKVIKKSFKDPEIAVQCNAAIWAGELGYQEYSEQIKALSMSSQVLQYEQLAEALIKLTPGE